MRKQLPVQTWTYGGQTFRASLFVDGMTIVGVSPVTTDGGVVVPTSTKAYLGDHVANGLARVGVKPCAGCEKRKEGLNKVDRFVRGIVS